MSFESIIEKLEAADTGSRELDAEIAILAGWRQKGPGSDWFYIEGNLHRQRQQPPQFSTSIDDALTLVPKGWGYSVGSGYAPGEVDPYNHNSWCEIWLRSNTGKATPELSGTRQSAYGKRAVSGSTVALALCVASLRAREAT